MRYMQMYVQSTHDNAVHSILKYCSFYLYICYICGRCTSLKSITSITLKTLATELTGSLKDSDV